MGLSGRQIVWQASPAFDTARHAALADQQLFERAAACLRNDDQQWMAGLQDGHTRRALAALLDILAGCTGSLDEAVRWQAREACRVLLGEPMASPTTRRTRRR